MTDSGRRGPVDVRLLHLVPALRRHLVVVGIVAAVTAVAVVVQAGLLARGLSDLVQRGDVDGGLAQLAIALTAVAVVRGGAVAVTEWSAGRAMTATRARVLDAVLDHAAADGDRASSGLASREATIATAGADELEPYVRQFLPALMLAVAVPLVAGVRILTADLLSAVLVAVTVPLIPVFMVLIGRMTERRTQRQWATLQRLGGHFLDVVEGLPTLRLFGRADAQRDSVHRVSEQYRSTTMGALRIAFLSALALELIATLSVALIAVEIGLRLAAGSFELYPALVILLLAPECYFPIRRVGASFHAAQAGLDASDDLHELLDRPTLPAGTRPAPERATVELRNVRLRRDGRSVVDGLDLDLVPGTVVAVVGPSGIGKSTVIEAVRGRLLDRDGAISVEGIDVDDLDPDSWAERLAVIGQRLVASTATVADAVRAGTDVTPAEVTAALAAVGLVDLDADHRRLEELSGGQLRRVQVARATIAVRCGRASIVLADEPTAHLDADAAEAVWRALDGLAREHGAAVLVATHDERAIADRVVELHSTAATAAIPAAASAATPALAVSSLLDDSAFEVTSLPARDEAGSVGPRRDGGRGVEPSRRSSWESGQESWRAVRRVMAMARPARRRFFGATGLGIAAEVSTLGLAAFAAWLIVRASSQPDLAELSLAILAVRAFGTGKGVFRYGERLATHDAGLRALSEIRASVVDRLARIAPAGIPGWERGDLLQRVVADIDRLLDLFVRLLGPIIAVAVTAGSAAVISLVLDVRAGLVLLGGLAVVAVVVPAATLATESAIGPSITSVRSRLSARVLAHTERLDDMIADRTATADRGRIRELDAERNRDEQRRTTVRALTGAVVAAGPLATVIVTLLVVDPGSIAAPILGVLVLWPLAVVELAGSTNEAAATVPTVATSAQRVLAVLDTPDPSPATSPATTVLGAGPPSITLEALTARWPGAEVDAVGPVSLDVAPASRHLIVGPSGSGKSTLAAVLVGFLPPASGDYRLDDVSVDAVADVRRSVTWIQQIPWLADSTVRENLRIADPEANDEVLADVLRAVHLTTWLDHLPHGLDSHLGRGGAAMSGGEAQRLALARVLLADQRVVVLDEPTANLDRATADAVMATVLERCADRSTIVLGHADRPDTSPPGDERNAGIRSVRSSAGTPSAER